MAKVEGIDSRAFSETVNFWEWRGLIFPRKINSAVVASVYTISENALSRGHRMKLKLEPDLTADVLALTNEYGYGPDEIISIGIALATVLLRERAAGNRVVVITPSGDLVSEFREVEPKAIYNMVKEYVQSVCSGMEETSAARLVAHLESERDLEDQHS